MVVFIGWFVVCISSAAPCSAFC